jgi:hypothetical protein
MAFIKQNFTIKKDQKYYRITALKTLKWNDLYLY